LGPQHPDTAISLNNLANLYGIQGKYEYAEPLLQRALAIHEQVLGPLHPNTITLLSNYVGLLRIMNRTEQAAELEARLNDMRDKEET